MSTNGYVLNAPITSDEDDDDLQINGQHQNIEEESASTSRSPGGSDLSALNQAYGVGVLHTSVSNTVEKAAKILELLMKTKQQIVLTGGSSNVTHGIHAADVEVVPGPATHTQGSSKVKIKDIVAYSWEQKYYSGNVVAIHKNGQYMAYCIKNTSKNASYVRVVNRKSSNRGLIKDIHGEVKDLAFAHSVTQTILAIIDEAGTLFVHQISENEAEKEIRCTLILKLKQNTSAVCKHRRVTWCHYLPEDPTLPTDAYSKLLVLTHDSIAEMIHLDTINKEIGAEISVGDLSAGYQKIAAHTKPISEAVFAPDGSALAIASLDGQVKFFQVYLQENTSTPRCLHQWEPHNGKPVTSLMFLDNHKNPKPDQSYWKFGVTGTDDNCEIKVWCCVEWTCLQVIHFQAPTIDTLQPCLKACLDLSAEYLLLSDINRRVLYVLQFHQEPDLSKACIVSLSEFPLTQPMLSLAFRKAGISRVKKSFDDPSDNLEIEDKLDSDREDAMDEEDIGTVDDQTSNEETVIKLIFVQPKSLQECCIAFPTLHFLPQKKGSELNISAMSQESIISFKDGLSDLSLSLDPTNDLSCSEDLSSTITPTKSSLNTQVLLTPDSFTSPSLNHTQKSATVTTPSNAVNASGSEMLTPGSVPLPPVSSNEEESLQSIDVGPLVDIDEQEPLATSEKINSNNVAGGAGASVQRAHHSSSSSPSREVAEILSPDSNRSTEYKGSAINEDQSTTNGNVTNHYKATTWPAAPNIGKITQQTSPLEPPGKSQAPKYSAEILEQLSASRKVTENFIKDFEKRNNTFESTIQAMLNVLQDQQEELKKQKEAITLLKEENKAYKMNSEQNFKSHIEAMQLHQSNMIKQTIDTCMMTQQQQNRQAQEQLMASMSQVVVNTVEAKMYNILKNELKNVFLPIMSKIFEPISEQLHMEITHKMNAIESTVKENSLRVIKSKATADAIASAVSSNVQSQMTQSYNDSFQNIILPVFEKTSQVMFEQVNENFQKGTKDYLHQVEAQVKRKQDENEKLMTFNKNQIQSMCEHVKSLATSVEKQQLKMDEMQKTMASQQEALCSSVLSAVRSRAATPVPGSAAAIVDPFVQQQHIHTLIKQEQINAAFQQALSASDLSLVIFACEHIDANKVFSQQPCPLEQPVILSLIQQLSTDLSSNTNLKYKYLEEALMNIDTQHAITRDHLPTILEGLKQKLEQFIKSNPDRDLVRKMKMLLMAAKSL